MNTRWYILRVRCDSEDLAAQWFRARLGLETYYPMAKRFVRPRWRKSKKPVEIDSAVFKGYIFVQAPAGFEWGTIWDNPHLVGYCFDGPGTSIFADSQIEELKRLEAKGEFVHFTCSDKSLLALLKNRIAWVKVLIGDDYYSLPGKVITIVNHEVYFDIPLASTTLRVNYPICSVFPELFSKNS